MEIDMQTQMVEQLDRIAKALEALVQIAGVGVDTVESVVGGDAWVRTSEIDNRRR